MVNVLIITELARGADGAVISKNIISRLVGIWTLTDVSIGMQANQLTTQQDIKKTERNNSLNLFDGAG